MVARAQDSMGNAGGDVSACCARWFAVYTKPRQEHTALLNLEGQSFECYLPMTDERRQRDIGGRKTRDTPLFPRYLFLNAAPELQSMATVRSTPGVVGLVRAGFELVSIPSSVIAALKSRMHPSTGLIAIDGIALASGDKVRVSDGPFAALEGIFKEHRGGHRSLMLLEILGRKIAVDINTRLLQRAD
jgi:transcriptional antiterminator RfaH